MSESAVTPSNVDQETNFRNPYRLVQHPGFAVNRYPHRGRVHEPIAVNPFVLSSSTLQTSRFPPEALPGNPRRHCDV